MFKVGDRVEFCTGENTGIIREIKNDEVGNPYYLIDWDKYTDYWNEIGFFSFDLVYPEMSPPDIDSICSCGAKHTSNPKYHLRFCDLFSSNTERRELGK